MALPAGYLLVDKIKNATEKHVAWTVDPTDDTRYLFGRGFGLLLLLSPSLNLHPLMS